ncbi:TetR/AcrR family transcriptional regulator [Streptomyces sp. NPDC101733]|uniref:TetR/AcrR family transcriptional regulator n=1 Tax=unclassified Streptomyces TaxID=2593676 RepID=UPI0038113758
MDDLVQHLPRAHQIADHPVDPVPLHGQFRRQLRGDAHRRAAVLVPHAGQDPGDLRAVQAGRVGMLDPDDPVDGLDVHLDHFVVHRNTVLAANRVLAGDPVVQTIIDGELDVLRHRLLDVLPLTDDSVRAAVAAVLKSWLVFVRVLCLDWLTEETCTRAELRDACAGALLGALRPFVPASVPASVPAFLDPGSVSPG